MKSDIKCPECNTKLLYHDKKRGEIVCKKCGYVLEEDNIDFSQDWRTFEISDKSKRRVGSPLTEIEPDRGTGTKIGTKKEILNLPSSERRKFLSMNKWQGRISTATERNLKFAFSELKRIVSILNLPKIVHEEAARIYRIAAERGLVRGRAMESVVAASIYAACRKHELPRTLDEIAQEFNLNRKEIGKTYRFISRQLNIRISPTSPLDYIYRFASELQLKPKTTSKAVNILKTAINRGITSGKGPMGIAAAALYIASILTGERRTQKDVAHVANVTEVTIRNRYKELIEELDLGEKIKSSTEN